TERGELVGEPPGGSPTSLGRKVERRLLLDGRCFACVAGQERNDAGRQHEGGARHQRPLVPVGRRRGDAVAGVRQRGGARGGEGGQDRQAEGGAELGTRVQESGRETGLVLADARVGRGGDTGKDGTEPERRDQEPGQDVRG